MGYELTKEQEADVHARVDFDMALRRLQDSHALQFNCSFRGVHVTRKPEWMPKLCAALSQNTTCTELDLSDSALTDVALQSLAATLAVPSKCPKLKSIKLQCNPQLTAVGETIAQGLCRLRPGLEVALGKDFDPTSTNFVHDKQLVPGLTAWMPEDLAVPGEQNQYYCPKEISGDG